MFCYCTILRYPLCATWCALSSCCGALQVAELLGVESSIGTSKRINIGHAAKDFLAGSQLALIAPWQAAMDCFHRHPDLTCVILL